MTNGASGYDAGFYHAVSPETLRATTLLVHVNTEAATFATRLREIAGEVEYTMLLIGMGLRILSLVPSQIPQVKRVIRAVDMKQCERLARKVGSFESERQVLNHLREEVRTVLPEMG